MTAAVAGAATPPPRRRPQRPTRARPPSRDPLEREREPARSVRGATWASSAPCHGLARSPPVAAEPQQRARATTAATAHTRARRLAATRATPRTRRGTATPPVAAAPAPSRAAAPWPPGRRGGGSIGPQPQCRLDRRGVALEQEADEAGLRVGRQHEQDRGGRPRPPSRRPRRQPVGADEGEEPGRRGRGPATPSAPPSPSTEQRCRDGDRAAASTTDRRSCRGRGGPPPVPRPATPRRRT